MQPLQRQGPPLLARLQGCCPTHAQTAVPVLGAQQSLLRLVA